MTNVTEEHSLSCASWKDDRGQGGKAMTFTTVSFIVREREEK